MKQVTITLTDDQAEKLKRFMYYKSLTGNLHPDDDPLDALGLWVAHQLAVADQEEEKLFVE